jgi:hypothetical protein
MNKVHWRDLTETEKAYFPNVAGSGWSESTILWLFNFLGFSFSNYVYAVHDFRFERGGNWWDFLQSNVYMMLLMQVDALNQDKVWKRFLLFFIGSPLAFLLVSTVGIFYFDFVPYRTKKEIIEQVKKVN